MIIDDKTYLLSDEHYIKVETIKKQIVIAHSSNSQMRHIEKWNHRLNGKYTKTAAFSIDTAGNVYKHFDPIYTSNFLGNTEYDKKSIIILLDNDGWLAKDSEKKQYINWIGHIYNNPDEVFEKRWRSHTYWAPYTEEQMNSAVELANMLCEEFFIPKFAIQHNTKLEGINNFEGVLYRSNFEKHFTDPSPAWKCEEFKYKLENK